MISGLDDVYEALQAQGRAQLAQHDHALRERLFGTIVAPNMRILRAGNGAKWNQPGWYSPLELAGSAAVSAPRDDFPVPDGCGTWRAIEHDARHRAAFRFFVRHAWLELPVPAAASTLSFLVPYMVMPEALARLTLSVAGEPVSHVAHPFPDACARVSIALDAALVERARHCGHLTLALATPIEAVPALIYPGSNDHRHLSLAICLPYFE